MGYKARQEEEQARLYRQNAPLWHQLLSAAILFLLMMIAFYTGIGWIIWKLLIWLGLPHDWQIGLLWATHICFAAWVVWLERKQQK